MKKAKQARAKATPPSDAAAGQVASGESDDGATGTDDQGEADQAAADHGDADQGQAEQAAADQGDDEQSQTDDEDGESQQPDQGTPRSRAEPILTLRLSSSLYSKLLRQAQDEGLGIEALAQEMLAESVVLRAFEIVERKNAMRGGNQGNQPQQGANPNNRNFNNRNTNHGSQGSQGPRHGAPNRSNNNNGSNNNSNRRPPNNNWMEDKAAFLEYVRNQEKRTRR